MKIAKKIVVTLLAGLLAAISGCDAQTCSDPCELADNCIDVNGDYSVVIQVTNDECGILSGEGASIMSVTATPSDTKTGLMMTFVNSGSLVGELCDTAQTAQPRKFGFATVDQWTDGSDQEILSVSGDFIDTVAGIHVCGAIVYTESTADTSCTSQAAFYSSTEYCN
ncbi:MAG: hypothetical protein JRJ19_04415 [Deltaproteobacteria bacterium]|nr:hypothetical protein [Deltaproteobacteria bacterium]MBW1871284.1 hypothetical protein [Deltaproteobacteria bacterium]